MASELFDVVQTGVVKIKINQTYPSDGCGTGASRPRIAQDHRLDGAHDLGDCRYGWHLDGTGRRRSSEIVTVRSIART